MKNTSMLLLTLSLGCLLSACATRVDRFVVFGARLARGSDGGSMAATAPRESSETLALDVHRIAPGQGTVISMRKFDPGSLRLIDDERFELVSVWIPQVGASGTFEIGRNGVESRYSSGPSAFPEEACVASATVGTLEVEPREDSVQVKMSLWVEFGGQGAKRAECPDLHLIDSGAYRVETIDGLTPWLGGPFERLYDATYRK